MTAVFLKSVLSPTDVPKGKKPQIALIGRSNVGKSSLLNKLTKQNGLAHVSAEPGRTRLINLFEIDRRFLLVDLPGYGFAAGSKQERQALQEMIQTYLAEAEHLVLALLIVDARRGITALDHEMLHLLQFSGRRVVMIVNKIDKLSKQELQQLAERLRATYPDMFYIFHSNVTGAGHGQIWQMIEQAVRGDS